MNSELVSIVVPAYNHARYLVEAIESIRAQDYPHIELIVIDDGSTDDTVSVLEKYGQTIRWVTQKNAGQSATLTRGWAMSSGSILAYLSADDALLPGAVSRSVEELRRHPEAALTYCDYELISPDSVPIRRVRAPETSWPDMVARVVCAPGPGAFFRRSAYEKAGPWDAAIRKVADYDFFLRLRREGEFHHIPEVLAQFRVHPGSQSYAVTDEKGAEELLAIVENYFKSDRLPPEVKSRQAEALGRAQLLAARGHMRAGRFRRAMALLRMAWTTDRRGMLSVEGGRILFNALFNRTFHAIYWRLLSKRTSRVRQNSQDGRSHDR